MPETSRRRPAVALLLAIALTLLAVVAATPGSEAEAAGSGNWRRPRRSTTTTTAPSTTTTTPSSTTTSTTTTSTTSTTAPPAPPGRVAACGTSLCVDGRPYRFTGVNAFQLATLWSLNYGCGSQVDDPAAFLSGLRPGSVVRFWAFQSQAYDKSTGRLDFAAIDRVVRAAEVSGQRLVLVLANHWADCDGPRKDEGWYADGYRTLVGPAQVLPYRDWVRLIVPRYAGSPAVAMWEPVNEPETTVYGADGSARCSPTSDATLRRFFDDVGGEIHRLAPAHLVESGVIGSGQCGANGSATAYQDLHRSAGIDVASYHDYGADDQPMPGDEWNGLRVRLADMAAVGKPLIVGEAGIQAADGVAGCPVSTLRRRDLFRAKMDAQFGGGVAGYLPWVWVEKPAGGCTHDIVQAQDPTLALLRDYPL